VNVCICVCVREKETDRKSTGCSSLKSRDLQMCACVKVSEREKGILQGARL